MSNLIIKSMLTTLTLVMVCNSYAQKPIVPPATHQVKSSGIVGNYAMVNK